MSPSPSRRRPKKGAEAKPASTRPFVAHHLAPPHEVLSEEESRQVLLELSTPSERLPKILVSDPGLQTDPKYVPMRDAGEPLVGRVVRIRRPSLTAGEAIAYRVIVDSIGGD
ncbi:MAG TPA: DNA-directed RNA polymerase subunit RpoH/Rpb5 C-terminal domain-containing protein [Thermoplasmata archaeon]|nr:DNA-directed RNA polymerase subunit RpoH/Rpb5 C-terminal domain-containing protein [Thermoplasmata archaeon]